MASGALWDRAWWAAALVLTSLHATDMPFYDSRINVAGWVLLAGLRCYGSNCSGATGSGANAASSPGEARI
jgi:hypothetical protein